jgi:hypothetical protein
MWKSTIAVTFFPGEKDVTVLFDPAPDNVSVKYYRVSLLSVNDDTVAYRQTDIAQSTKYCFTNVHDGIYYIMVSSLR